MNSEQIDDIEALEELESLELADHEIEAQEIISRLPPGPALTETSIFSKLQTIYDKSAVPVLITDSSFQIVYGNPEFIDSIIRHNEFMGKSFFNIIDSTDHKINTSRIINNLRSNHTGYSWIGKVSIYHTRFLNVTANAIFTPVYEGVTEIESLPIGYICMFDDITKETREILSRTYLSLLEASKLKDNDTGNHIRRVGEYSRIISKFLFINHLYPEVNVEFIDNIAFLAPMHDVGKIGTPDDILNKNGPLDEKEWRIMKEHTINGGFIMGGYPDPMAKQIPLSHHEWWNGTGYPYQLSEDMIPLSARIVTIADVYDALRMKRSYKDAFSHEKACAIMEEDSGTHFDPNLIKVFLEIEAKIMNVFELLGD